MTSAAGDGLAAWTFVIPPKAWKAQLEATLEGMDGDQAELRERVRRFVLVGDTPEVLQAVAGDERAGTALRIINMARNRGKFGDVRIYDDWGSVPPAVGLRWAKLLSAAASSVAHRPAFSLPRGIEWLEALLRHACGRDFNSYGQRSTDCPTLTHRSVEALLEKDRLAKFTLLKAAFATDVSERDGKAFFLSLVTELPDYAEALERHVEAIRPLLRSNSVHQKLHMLALLGRANDATLVLLVDELCQFALEANRDVRGAAGPLLERIRRAALSALVRVGRRSAGVQLGRISQTIRSLQTEADRAALEDLPPALAASAIKPDPSTLRKAAGKERRIAVPSQPIDWSVGVTPDAEKAIDVLFWSWNAGIDDANVAAKAGLEAARARGEPGFEFRQTPRFEDNEITAIKAYLVSDTPINPRTVTQWRFLGPWNFPRVWRIFVSNAAVTPVLAVKILNGLGAIQERGPYLEELGSLFVDAINAYYGERGALSLHELSEMLSAMGISAERIFASMVRERAIGNLAYDWRDEDISPFLLRHAKLVAKAIKMSSDLAPFYVNRRRLYAILEQVPPLAEMVMVALFDLALSGAKAERARARRALQAASGTEAKILEALQDVRWGTRAAAANWLSDLGLRAAIPDLQAALARENNIRTRAAIATAIQQLRAA